MKGEKDGAWIFYIFDRDVVLYVYSSCRGRYAGWTGDAHADRSNAYAFPDTDCNAYRNAGTHAGADTGTHAGTHAGTDHGTVRGT